MHDVTLPEWANQNPFYFCMKYREFIEDPLYSKDLPEWIDMIFGKKQQRKESKNIFFSFATPEYFNNTSTEEILKTEALMSATEFYQLPRKLFMNKHRNITNKDPNDLREETEISNKIFGNESEMLKEEIRVRVNDTIICRNFSKEDPFERMTIIGGNLKDECNSFYLVWKINKVIPLISVHKNKKERDNSTTKEKLTFEIVDPKDKYLLPMNYVSQFTLNRKEFVVIGRLVTSQFAIVDTSSEPMECKYFGVDALTNTITAIHCSKDNKSIIAGYETGTIAIWEIKSSINQEESKEERKL